MLSSGHNRQTSGHPLRMTRHVAKSKTSLTQSKTEWTGGGTLRGSVTCFFLFEEKGACHARAHRDDDIDIDAADVIVQVANKALP